MSDTPKCTWIVPLWDHSQPCEHYDSYPHYESKLLDLGAIHGGAVLEDGHWMCNVPGCPGGRERTFEGTRLKCFEPEWLTEDTVVWVEVSDGE